MSKRVYPFGNGKVGMKKGRNAMINRVTLLKEIETLPPSCLDEVVKFVAWIKHRELSQIPETMLLSETALAKDWSTPEEDKAWADL